MARGRPIIGVDLIDRLDGPRALRRRVRIVLATIAGRLTIAQACAELGVGRTQFHKLRWRVLEGALDGAAAAAARPTAPAAARVARGAAPAGAHPRARRRAEDHGLTQRNRADDAVPARSSRAEKKRRGPRPRAEAGRDTRRSREQHVRRACVAWAASRRWLDERPSRPRSACRCGRCGDGRRRGAPPDRGRPTHAITRAEAAMMHLALAVHGPHAGVATLQAWCPSASRRAIARWRRARRRAARRRLHVVRWTRARPDLGDRLQ